jgi:hypothetical protein
MNNLDRYLRLALKAQAHCRKTLQTLVEAEYPKQATVIRQANIAEQQQEDNATIVRPESPMWEVLNKMTNELLEGPCHEAHSIGRDSQASNKTGGNNPELAAVGGESLLTYAATWSAQRLQVTGKHVGLRHGSYVAPGGAFKSFKAKQLQAIRKYFSGGLAWTPLVML